MTGRTSEDFRVRTRHPKIPTQTRPKIKNCFGIYQLHHSDWWVGRREVRNTTQSVGLENPGLLYKIGLSFTELVSRRLYPPGKEMMLRPQFHSSALPSLNTYSRPWFQSVNTGVRPDVRSVEQEKPPVLISLSHPRYSSKTNCFLFG